MKVEYYPESEFGRLLLDPVSFNGVVFDSEYEYGVCRMSLYRNGCSGVPFHITDRDSVTRSPEYFNWKIDKRTWRRLKNYAAEGNLKEAENIVGGLEKQIKDAPKFIKETNDFYEKKEFMILWPFLN